MASRIQGNSDEMIDKLSFERKINVKSKSDEHSVD